MSRRDSNTKNTLQWILSIEPSFTVRRFLLDEIKRERTITNARMAVLRDAARAHVYLDKNGTQYGEWRRNKESFLAPDSYMGRKKYNIRRIVNGKKLSLGIIMLRPLYISSNHYLFMYLFIYFYRRFSEISPCNVHGDSYESCTLQGHYFKNIAVRNEYNNETY